LANIPNHNKEVEIAEIGLECIEPILLIVETEENVDYIPSSIPKRESSMRRSTDNIHSRFSNRNL
jgi:hypothetical protein